MVAVFEGGHVHAGDEGVGAGQALVGMVLDEVVPRGHGHHVAVLPHADGAQDAGERPGFRHQFVEFDGILLDHRHGVAGKGGGVVAQRPTRFGERHLHGLGRGIGADHRAQLVVALVGEVGGGFLRLGEDLAGAVHHQHVVHAEKLAVFLHLGVGDLEARLVQRHEAEGLGLRAVDLVERGRVLLGFRSGRLQQPGQGFPLLFDVASVAFQRKAVLLGRQDESHGHGACDGERHQKGGLDFEVA